MKVRAKFTTSRVTVFGSGGKQSNISRPDPANVPGAAYQNYVDSGVPYREITLTAEYDSQKNPEDISFAQATPSGTITFSLNNPDLKDEFKPGQQYYVEFIPIEN